MGCGIVDRDEELENLSLPLCQLPRHSHRLTLRLERAAGWQGVRVQAAELREGPKQDFVS
jgi:hypothetical protein